MKIFAFEPFPANFENCMWNLRINRVTNVHLSPKAITKDGRSLTMATNPTNSGGASAVKETFIRRGVVRDIPSLTLDEVFRAQAIDRCKLLKIDCEGLEYEVLYNTRVLDRVDYLAGEFHCNAYLEGQNYRPERLMEYCSNWIPSDRMAVQPCWVSD